LARKQAIFQSRSASLLDVSMTYCSTLCHSVIAWHKISINNLSLFLSSQVI